MKPYDHLKIEPKWQQRWQENKVFATPTTKDQEKMYVLDMFPYPSGYGLHVGHLLPYTGSDVVARVARMQGKAVLHPMGWDAFGLPAENFAIKTGVHPAISTDKNTVEFKRQLGQIGTTYDWDKEIDTSKPEYYRWTQWLFQLLYKRGLAYRKDGLVNWCPSCQTVLANEQVVQGTCERCGSTVEQRMLKQWYFKITDYADRLLKDLDTLDWPEKIKAMQRNWIGRSEGAFMLFAVDGKGTAIKVFTTRPDTMFGVTYLVVAPEYPNLESLVTLEQQQIVADYQEKVAKKSELQRLHLDQDKSGVFTGSFAINPANGEKVPIWVADYVLGSYGTGAVMGVPGHDDRDRVFAETYDLPIIKVISENGEVLENSEQFTGKAVVDALPKMLDLVKAEKTVTYRLRDWLVSRQRFWGAPIPIMYDQAGNELLVPEDQLPIELPMNVSFKPTGKSPLVDALEWKIVHQDGKEYLRETDTIDGFICSSWYYLRFPSPHYSEGPFDPEAIKQWLPVDTYIGGAEHAVLHLLYARFFTKVLYDAGMVSFQEPFQSLHNQGMILGPDHAKMSKSKGNVINPDDVVKEYGADTIRMYELFMGPFDQEKPWSVKGIIGVRRFVEKLWKLSEKVEKDTNASPEELRLIHGAIKRVTENVQQFKFNTAVSTLMETVNGLTALPSLNSETWSLLLRIVSPLAPHITEELWAEAGFKGFCSIAPWPVANVEYLLKESIEYPIQVNGKVRARLHFSPTESREVIEKAVLADATVKNWLQDKPIKKIIVVPGKLVSLVI